MVKTFFYIIILINLGLILPALIYCLREALLEQKEEHKKEYYEKHGCLPKGERS